MAVSPLQLNASFLREVDSLEVKLDTLLTKESLNSIGDSVSIDCSDGLTEGHLQILRERYKKSGWKNVTRRSEQLHGAWIVFES